MAAGQMASFCRRIIFSVFSAFFAVVLSVTVSNGTTMYNGLPRKTLEDERLGVESDAEPLPSLVSYTSHPIMHPELFVAPPAGGRCSFHTD